ncbi:MAG: hypothetical protein KatS3mg081_1240 [Gemmatimonadales bacterium]|nr:MAG: hypothetical protein KatS3mg081_1240 [Gemmatimonadales bacterium]
MSGQLSAAEEELIEHLAASARGPRQNGLFAVWLFLRACDGALPPDPLKPRTHRKRVEALERRLSSLALPPPLKRAFALALRELAEGTPSAAVVALKHLAAPARETLGPKIGEVLERAATRARGATA